MTIRTPVASRNASLDSEFDRVDAGPGPGTLKIYSGGQPATADTAASGTHLATFTLADPGFAPASTGVKTIDADPDLTTSALSDGTAGWARAADSTGATVFDGSVGASGSGADFIINSTAITSGQPVALLSGTVTYPA